MPTISIIVATYNSARTLFFTLQSIQKQTMEDFEVLVIGDACTDESQAVVSSLQDQRFLWSNLPKRTGVQSGPNNEGIQRAKGQYIAYLGHDDLWFPWHLEQLFKEITTSACDLVFSLTARICPKETTLLMKCSKEQYLKRNAPPSSWIHKKSMTDRCGLWDMSYKTLSYPVDTDLWRRACLAKMQINQVQRLSVLKFPSVCWNLYASLPHEEPQQKFYFDQMTLDAKKLELNILIDMSFCWAETKSVKGSLINRCMNRLIQSIHAIDCFPFPYLKKMTFQKNRRKRLKARGLLQDFDKEQ